MAAAPCEASKGEFEPAESDGVVYLDSAGKTQLPLSVLEVGEKALKRKVTIVQCTCHATIAVGHDVVNAVHLTRSGSGRAACTHSLLSDLSS